MLAVTFGRQWFSVGVVATLTLVLNVNVCLAHQNRPSNPTQQFAVASHGILEEVFRWKQIGYTALQTDTDGIQFPDEDQAAELRMERLSAERSNYVAYNNVPMGVTHHKGRLFVTVPRRRPGIPATLSFISTKSTAHSSPSFRAYPSHQTNELHPQLRPDTNRIVSVYRTRIDACNRLWFIDTGLLEYPNNRQQVQEPSIWVIDPETDIVIRKFSIPTSIVQFGNGLASITVDVDTTDCDNAFAYIPDLATYHLYAYDFAQNRIWSFSHNYFSFDPLQGDFNVGGQQFQWNDGIFSLTLGPRNPDGFRTAYFHAMASTTEFSVSTRVLRNEQMAARSNHGDDFKVVGNRGPSTQSAMHDYDPSTGVIFYSQVATNGVGCWNSNRPLVLENVFHLQRNNETMIYPADLNVDAEGTLWALTNSMPIFIYDTLDSNVYNFRIWKAKTKDIIRGTACDKLK